MMFEPGRHNALNSSSVEPRTVPTQNPQLLGCPYGMLLNDLYRSPDVVCDAVVRLMDAGLALDTGSVCDTGADEFNDAVLIILYLSRLSCRVLNYVHYVVSRTEHPSRSPSMRTNGHFALVKRPLTSKCCATFSIGMWMSPCASGRPRPERCRP